MKNIVNSKKNYNELQIAFNKIEKILNNKKKSISNINKYDYHVKGMSIDGILCKRYSLRIKQLFHAWKNNVWRDGSKFYYGIGGSVLSGMSFWYYYDMQEKEFGTDKMDDFLTKVNQLKPYISRTEYPYLQN